MYIQRKIWQPCAQSVFQNSPLLCGILKLKQFDRKRKSWQGKVLKTINSIFVFEVEVEVEVQSVELSKSQFVISMICFRALQICLVVILSFGNSSN
jgi:hypothetical protein